MTARHDDALHEIARQVRRRDEFAQPLRTVAGFQVHPADGGAVMVATTVLLDADTLQVLDRQVVRVPATATPRVPGADGNQELAALLQVLAQLAQAPDLVFVSGHGIAHPQRLGIAAHFGVAADLPSIGVATEVLVGTAAALHEIRGAHTPLRVHGEQLGWLLRSKPGSPALVVSPGHRVSMTAAAQLVMRYVTTDRLPEPTRLLG
jgi:deoxyribonuclease V